LSLWAKIFLLLTMAVVAVWIFRNVYSFLAVSDGGSGDVMVVEGWISARRIDQAAAAFRRGRYREVLVVRDVYEGGDKWASGRYAADYVAADLIHGGVPKGRVHTLFCRVAHRDRTYTCAIAARQWFHENRIALGTLDVVTLAAHARRSRLLYRKALGEGCKIGVIALDDPSYDPFHWWRSSEGIREIMGETAAYLYARVFFHPTAPDGGG
jgi:hypothetical protein